MAVPPWSVSHKVDAQGLLLKLQQGGISVITLPWGWILYHVVVKGA